MESAVAKFKEAGIKVHQFKIQLYEKYLGFLLGADGQGRSWKPVGAKLLARAHLVKSLGEGLITSLVAHN
eukprot:1220140-Pyramimonas_sp.AAC.1